MNIEKFLNAYGKDAYYVFGKVLNEILWLASNMKSHCHWAADFSQKTEAEVEDWIMEHVVPHLEKAAFPIPGTTEFAACFTKLKLEILA